MEVGLPVEVPKTDVRFSDFIRAVIRFQQKNAQRSWPRSNPTLRLLLQPSSPAAPKTPKVHRNGSECDEQCPPERYVRLCPSLCPLPHHGLGVDGAKKDRDEEGDEGEREVSKGLIFVLVASKGWKPSW